MPEAVEIQLSSTKTMTIHENSSVTLKKCEYDKELDGLDCDIIDYTKEEARKLAQTLIEELG